MSQLLYSWLFPDIVIDLLFHVTKLPSQLHSLIQDHVYVSRQLFLHGVLTTHVSCFIACVRNAARLEELPSYRAHFIQLCHLSHLSQAHAFTGVAAWRYLTSAGTKPASPHVQHCNAGCRHL